MTFVHGKDTYISLDGDDLSTYTTTSQLEQTADTHDVTTYGKTAHVKKGGLLDGTATMSGIFDNTLLTGPKGVIQPLIGQTVELIRRPDGTGAGKVEDTVMVVVNKYTETSPVADMVTWSCDMELSDTLATTTQ